MWSADVIQAIQTDEQRVCEDEYRTLHLGLYQVSCCSAWAKQFSKLSHIKASFNVQVCVGPECYLETALVLSHIENGVRPLLGGVGGGKRIYSLAELLSVC